MQRKHMLPLAAVLVSVLAALLLVSNQALAARLNGVVVGPPLWNVQMLASAPVMGDCPVTRLDSAGHPSVVYFDSAAMALYFIRSNGTAWSAPVEVAPALRGKILCESGMTLNAAGLPVVVFATNDNRLFYAPSTSSGGGVTFTPVQVTITLMTGKTGVNPQYPVVVLDSSGNPQIMFRYKLTILANPNMDPIPYSLIYVSGTNMGGTWQWHTEEPMKADGVSNVLVGAPMTPGMGEPLSVVRDSAGTLHLSYYCMRSYTWYLTRTAAGVWSVPLNLDTDPNHYGIDITLDSAGAPHIVTIVKPAGSVPTLILFSCNGGNCTASKANWTLNELDWLPDEAATSEISGVRTSFSSINRPYISYYYRDASGVAGLKLIYYDGTAYQKTMVDARNTQVGRHAWLNILPDDQPMLTYSGGASGGLLQTSQMGNAAVQLFLPVTSR